MWSFEVVVRVDLEVDVEEGEYMLWWRRTAGCRIVVKMGVFTMLR